MPPKRQTSSRDNRKKFLYPLLKVHIMETEISGLILGVVLPIYPLLYVIHQKIGRYDEVIEEFKLLRDEHERTKEAYHGH
jgi:hypothetical protein